MAMAHAAVSAGVATYGRVHFGIRSRLYKGLTTGTMQVGSLVDEERFKLTIPQSCGYCGAETALAVDHLLPTHAGGPETADNIVWACRACNSSKGSRDMLAWLAAQQRFPPLLLLRRYLKLAILECRSRDLLAHSCETPPALPFDLQSVPQNYPAPAGLVLWQRAETGNRSADGVVK